MMRRVSNLDGQPSRRSAFIADEARAPHEPGRGDASCTGSTRPDSASVATALELREYCRLNLQGVAAALGRSLQDGRVLSAWVSAFWATAPGALTRGRDEENYVILHPLL